MIFICSYLLRKLWAIVIYVFNLNNHCCLTGPALIIRNSLNLETQWLKVNVHVLNIKKYILTFMYLTYSVIFRIRYYSRKKTVIIYECLFWCDNLSFNCIVSTTVSLYRQRVDKYSHMVANGEQKILAENSPLVIVSFLLEFWIWIWININIEL